MELTYTMRRSIRCQVGALAAAVFDVLAHHDTGNSGMVEITTKLLSSESGVSPKTVQRVMAELGDEGLVKCERQFRNNRQVANRYYLSYERVGGGQSGVPGGQRDQAIGTTSQLEVLDMQVVSNSDESVVVPGDSGPGIDGEGLRPSGAHSPPSENPQARIDNNHREEEQEAPEVEAGTAGVMPTYYWPPRNSPMPLPVGGPTPGGRRFLDSHRNALWLVSYVEGHVVERDNRENAAKGRRLVDEVGGDRKCRWFRNAYELVSRHPLQEIVDVVDWLFGTQRGHAPSWIAESSRFPWNGKVTHIQQVEENYDLLREAMASGVEPNHTDELIAGGFNWSSQHLDDGGVVWPDRWTRCGVG